MPDRPTIAVIGLGYVGLPLAVALARDFDTIGLDVDARRVAEIAAGNDRTGEVDPAELAERRLALTADPADAWGRDMYIVTVPTPVDAANRPDLSFVDSATRTVAALVDPARCPTIVYESTVYPGVTEDRCGRILEKAGLVRGRDFRLGYSPERINPGDRMHRVDTIVKVIAGEDDDVLDRLDTVYSAITSAGTFRAASIRAAEGAKVIENAQRDINVAFMNEVARIMGDAGVSAWDVLDAARTKWNFLPFEPGLVGGHCIGVDPYYLAHLAERSGHHPQVILAGRETNDRLGAWVVERLHARRGGTAGRALVMGLTFKENVPDLRNSRSSDLVEALRARGYDVDVTDALADPKEVERRYGQPPVVPAGYAYDLVLVAVRHDAYARMAAADIAALVAPGGTLADVKGLWRTQGLAQRIDYWTF